MPEGPRVQQMFTDIAPRYDLANRILSAGIDRRWRRRAVRLARPVPGETALDVCSGTGDLLLDLARAGLRAVGSDFTIAMLRLALPKIRRRRAALAHAPALVAGDTMALPFRDHAFDLVTVAFGIRNVADPVAALREMRRVTRPGGRIVVLEFCKPRVPLVGPLYGLYFRRMLPVLGRMISGDQQGAYSYLPRSVMGFPEREGFLALMREAGLTTPTMRILTCGIAALYRAEVGR